MRRSRAAALAARLLLLPLLAGVAGVAQPAEAATIVVDPAIRHQAFEGWGTSLCWWAVLAGRWSETNRQALIGAIVDPDTGLGYTCFRYNIGGGDQPGHTHLAVDRAVPGFQTREGAPYDWTADQAQRDILLGIARRGGKGLIFEAFSNSPPWWMTVSGCVSGNANGADNLKPDYFAKFATYLADVTQHYRRTHGIVFRTIDPFNEPSAGWWKNNGGQEGCGFKSNQARMIKELGKALVARGLYPGTSVGAADETSIAQAVTTLKGYDDSAFSFLSQINTHSYSGWNARAQIDSAARARGKNLWQSESGPLGKGSDPSDITMWMSHVIIQDLRKMKANAWLDWQVNDPGANWSSIDVDHSKQTFRYRGRYYMHAAFSRFIRPGDRIVESSDTNTVAAETPRNWIGQPIFDASGRAVYLDSLGRPVDPDAGRLTIVIRNPSTTSASHTIDLRKVGARGTTAQIHRFALPGSLVRQPDLRIGSTGTFEITVPGLTLTTLVVPYADPTPVGVAGPGASRPDVLRAAWSRSGQLRLEGLSRGAYEVDVLDMAGRRIAHVRGSAAATETVVDLGGAEAGPGLYSVRVRQNGTGWSGQVAIVR